MARSRCQVATAGDQMRPLRSTLARLSCCHPFTWCVTLLVSVAMMLIAVPGEYVNPWWANGSSYWQAQTKRLHQATYDRHRTANPDGSLAHVTVLQFDHGWPRPFLARFLVYRTNFLQPAGTPTRVASQPLIQYPSPFRSWGGSQYLRCCLEQLRQLAALGRRLAARPREPRARFTAGAGDHRRGRRSNRTLGSPSGRAISLSPDRSARGSGRCLRAVGMDHAPCAHPARRAAVRRGAVCPQLLFTQSRGHRLSAIHRARLAAPSGRQRVSVALAATRLLCRRAAERPMAARVRAIAATPLSRKRRHNRAGAGRGTRHPRAMPATANAKPASAATRRRCAIAKILRAPAGRRTICRDCAGFSYQNSR